MLHENIFFTARQEGVRWLGKRPHVRGVAMNSCRPSVRGGEGRSSGGCPSVLAMGQAGRYQDKAQ